MTDAELKARRADAMMNLDHILRELAGAVERARRGQPTGDLRQLGKMVRLVRRKFEVLDMLPPLENN